MSQTITIGGTALTQSYGYDTLNRLTSASENSGASWSEQYGYDRYGNMYVPTCTGVTLTALTPTSLNWFDASKNRLNQAVLPNVSYDVSGNLLHDAGSGAMVYDAENRQLTYNGTAGQYVYDGDGRRVKKVDSSGTMVMVYDAGGRLIAEYTSGNATGSGTSYITADHLGSTRVVTDASGAVTRRASARRRARVWMAAATSCRCRT